MPAPWPDKDPDDTLDYGLDLTALIGDPADGLVSSTCVVETGDVVVQQHGVVVGNQRTVTWLKGGSAGTSCLLRIRTITSLGRQVDQTMSIKIAQR